MAKAPSRQFCHRAPLAAAAALFLAHCGACEDTGVLALSPAVQVQPLVLDFGEVPLSVRVQGTVTIRSVGDVMLTIERVHLANDQFFRLLSGPAPQLLPSLSDVAQVEATPTQLGLQETLLYIETDDPGAPRIAVPIRLTGVPTPPCDDGNTCTEDIFDAASNSCQHTYADGTACFPADKCVVDAVCSQGVCLGTTKVCDDQSPCTQDYCRQTDGECVFLESPLACDDNNPCTADSCGVGGCEHAALLNGEPCDDGDECSRNDACFSGACVGSAASEGSTCDDHNSCTIGETCQSGVCRGASIIEPAVEGQELFTYNLTEWDSGAFLHRREVSLSDNGVFYGLDHLRLPNNEGLSHVVFAMHQCGSEVYQFSYRPPDAHVLVSYVRRAMQLNTDDRIRMVVGVRQRIEDGFQPQTTTYLLDRQGRVVLSGIQTLGGETGRSLLPDGSHIHGLVWPLTDGPPGEVAPMSNLVVVREDNSGHVLWRHERSSGDWAEFLGVAGPRVLFWASSRFGALDFNTGALVWSQETDAITKEMALSTPLNLGVARTSSQLIGVEILSGQQIFTFPEGFQPDYVPRTDPVIAPDGRILVLMERRDSLGTLALALEWVELDPQGTVLSTKVLDYVFPDWGATRHEDHDDPYPTVADDGVAYVGYGDHFWALDPGGNVRWTLTSTVPNAFTGSVPLLRDDGVLLINRQSRKIIGVKTNGGQMSQTGWASFRHDGRRTNFTP